MLGHDSNLSIASAVDGYASKCHGLCTAEQDVSCRQSPGYLPANKCAFATMYHTDRNQQFEDEYAGLQAAFSKEAATNTLTC